MGPKLISKWVGESERVREIFIKARQAAPCTVCNLFL
ncbi:MAG TPA: hypothetical protein VH796_09580 [Nitrososphaeraceae archaeon]